MNHHPKKIYLYLGIGLPTGFLLLFLILTLLANFIEPPKNDVLLVKQNYNLTVSIKNNKIDIQKKKDLVANDKNLPHIIRFNPTTKKTIKYKVTKLQQGNVTSYTVPDFPKNLKVDTNKISNDGYKFVCNSNDYIFFMFNKDRTCVLHKWIKNVHVKDSSTNTVFLGWIAND